MSTFRIPPTPLNKGGLRGDLSKGGPKEDSSKSPPFEGGIKGGSVEDPTGLSATSLKKGGSSEEELKKRGLAVGDFHLPYNPKLIARARELRKNMTEPECKLWFGYFRNFKHRVLRQRPIDHYIVDFYCPYLKLVIEIDGETHFTDEGKEYDEERTKILEGYGLHVMRFTNTDVMTNLQGVCSEIDKFVHRINKLNNKNN